MVATPGADDLVKDGSDAGFMKDVIEASRTQPVLVDFWAPWCGPCKTLTPLLERAVRAAGGKVKLVKINTEEHPGVAAQLGVRSIPAVFAFDRGRPVDGFMGAIPESQIKLFLARLTSGAAAAAGPEEIGEDDLEEALKLGEQALEQRDLATAAELFAAVMQEEPENLRALAGLARCYLAMGEVERVRQLLDLVPAEKVKDASVQSLQTALALAIEAEGAGDPATLERAIEADPTDLQLRHDAAVAHAGRGDLARAVEHLLYVISKDRGWNEDAARKQLIKIFDAAGPTSEIAKSGRKRLSAILFS